VLSHRTVGGHPVQATGHGDLVEDADGRWWLVFLGIRPQGWPAFHVLGRETFLAPVRWQDGWPFVDGPVGLEVDDGPSGQRRPPATWRDDFTAPALRGTGTPSAARIPPSPSSTGGCAAAVDAGAAGEHRAFVGPGRSRSSAWRRRSCCPAVG
jgi:beta-xylosidase